MVNTLVSQADLVDFGDFDVAMVDVAAAAVRRDAGWHIAPRLTETIAVESYGGQELILPTRSFPSAPVVVTAVTGAAGALADYQLRPSGILYRGGPASWGGISGSRYGFEGGWPVGYISVTLTHGLAACPPDLLPLLAQLAQEATARRSARVTSFTNGGIQMAFGDAYQLDPDLAKYAVFAGVS